MPPKKLLLTKKDIVVFFRSKTRLCAGSIVRARFHYNSLHVTRWAFIVSSTICKNAVMRNTTRRRMAEIVRDIKREVVQGLDVMLFVSLKEKKAPSTKQLRNDIIQILHRCGVL